MKYPVFLPDIQEQDIQNVTSCLREGWIGGSSPYVTDFERLFSDYIGCKYAVTVNNGTSALEVALAAVGVRAGDEVILPAFTIASCAYAIQRLGAKPIFVDVDPEYYCINPEKISCSISPKTKAILVVNMYGNPCDVESIKSISYRHNLPVVEDCSENLGGSYKGKRSGSHFEVSTFSFYVNKTITSGEGGMVCMNSHKLFDKALRYKNLDFPPSRDFEHQDQAYNFRMASPLCALAHSQLKRINLIVEEKVRLYHAYLQRVDGQILRPLIERPESILMPWMNCFEYLPEHNFDYHSFASAMKCKGIQVRPFFSNLSKQKAFSSGDKLNDSFPVTDRIAHRGFYLPSYTALQDSDLKYIVDACHDCLNEFK